MGVCPSKTTRLTLLEEANELYRSLANQSDHTGNRLTFDPTIAVGGASARGIGSRMNRQCCGSVCSSGNRPGRVHQYVKLHTLGRGRAAKVRLCENMNDGELFAMKIFHKSLLRRQRMWDEATGEYHNALDVVAREVAILKKLRHPQFDASIRLN